MTATDTTIVNLALKYARSQARLIALDTDTSKEAKDARDIYAHKRDALQRAHTWNFNKTRVELASVAPDDALIGYQYAFAWPTDAIRIGYISPTGDQLCRIEYKLETVKVSNAYVRVILCDSSTLFAGYNRQVTTPALFDTSFIEVFAWDLAAVLTDSTAQSDFCNTKMRMALASARSTNGIEDWPDPMPAGSWVTARDDDGATGFGSYWY